MRLTCEISDLGAEGILTTDHALSSYGQPVLVVDGSAYGSGDVVGLGRLGCDLEIGVRDGSDSELEACRAAGWRIDDRR